MYTYLYGFPEGWSKHRRTEPPHYVPVACPNWSRWVRTQDTPSEFRLVSGGNLEFPTSWSIKRDTIGDIYRNHPYIGADARVNNRQGVRISFAYKETGHIEGSLDPTSDYHILPFSCTINCTLPVIQAYSDTDRADFFARVIGAFMGVDENGDDDDCYADFTLRWAGDLRPHHWSDVLG